MVFLTEHAHFASWHECCRYIRQSTKHMQHISENAYNYYVKLLLGLIGVYSASWFNDWTKKKYRLTNNVKGTGLKHYGCKLFSAIVHIACFFSAHCVSSAQRICVSGSSWNLPHFET